MSDVLIKMFMNPKQRALFDAVNTGQVQTRTGYTLNMRGSFSTTTFTTQTDMGVICATFAKQNAYEMKPNDYYTVSIISRDAVYGVSADEYSGLFARAMYNKLKKRYEQRNCRAR